MIDILNMAMDVGGGVLGILGGIGQVKGAKKIEKAKRGLYNVQLEGSKKRAEWNEKEILKSFTDNYAKTAYSYGQKVADIIGQQTQVQSELKTSVVAAISDAEIADSSFYNTAKLEANKEFDEAVQTMLTNQSENLLGLAKERDTQIMQNTTELGQAMYKNQMQGLQAKQEKEAQILSGLTSIVGGAADIYGSDTLSKFTGKGADKSGISDTASKAGGFSSALKKSSGSHLQLTTFG